MHIISIKYADSKDQRKKTCIFFCVIKKVSRQRAELNQKNKIKILLIYIRILIYHQLAILSLSTTVFLRENLCGFRRLVYAI